MRAGARLARGRAWVDGTGVHRREHARALLVRASSSCAMLTWILVALRAATEPVKEEAMQAILEV